VALGGTRWHSVALGCTMVAIGGPQRHTARSTCMTYWATVARMERAAFSSSFRKGKCVSCFFERRVMSTVVRKCSRVALGLRHLIDVPTTRSASQSVTHSLTHQLTLHAPDCALHGLSPRDRWLCVLPGWRINVNVNHAPSQACARARLSQDSRSIRILFGPTANASPARRV
jgi:hypothetical protein